LCGSSAGSSAENGLNQIFVFVSLHEQMDFDGGFFTFVPDVCDDQVDGWRIVAGGCGSGRH
jgi:hypothetical protein